MQLVKNVGSVFHPSMSIEGQTFRGNYQDSNAIFKAFCSTLVKKPEVCSTVSIKDHYNDKIYGEEKNPFIDQLMDWV